MLDKKESNTEEAGNIFKIEKQWKCIILLGVEEGVFSHPTKQSYSFDRDNEVKSIVYLKTILKILNTKKFIPKIINKKYGYWSKQNLTQTL